jgi:hypothetical protein
MTIRRCIVRIEFGQSPKDFKVILDDGSELHGITKAEAWTEYERFATFRMEGLVMAGKGMNGEPMPIVCTRPEGEAL